MTTNHSRRHRVSISNWGKYFFKILWLYYCSFGNMATGTGSLQELREKRKMERAASEHGNSNKIIQGEDTGIHSKL